MSVKLFFWNIRGLNDPDKHRTFVNWLLFHKPLFGTLLESHVKEVSLLPLMTKLCRSWNFYLNHQSDKDGRIILIWKHPLKVQVLSADRSDLWAELMYLHDTFDLQNNRWVVGGDFNQIIVPSEHSSHFVAAQDSQMYQFQDCLLHNGLFDLRYNGHFITNCAGKCASVTNSATVPGGKSLERSLDLPISIAFVKSERYNAVRSFTTAMGTLITDPIEMSHLAVSHFQSVLGPWSNTSPPINSLPSWFAQLTNFRVPQLQAEQMLVIPSTSEITKQFFKLNPNKAPGPDGLISGFFKASWDILGEEVILSVQHFFASSFLHSAANSTILSLIPKFPGATKITDYHPISIKVDIAKAFDTLSWDFILSCLQGLQLPSKFISWIKACICTTHLSFADDLLIFIDGSLRSVQNVLQALKEFEGLVSLSVSKRQVSMPRGCQNKK